MPRKSLVLITALFLYFHCAASHSAIDTLRNPIPGVEDFPRITGGIYYTFQEMPLDTPEFPILNQMFNGTQRSQTFTFPIFVDDVPEGVEELQLTLSLQPDDQLPEGSVNVTPAVATVRILDSSCKFIRRFGHWFSHNKVLYLLLTVVTHCNITWMTVIIVREAVQKRVAVLYLQL